MFVPARKAALLSILGGNLFLPATGIAIAGFPNYTKLIAAGLGALLVACFFAFPKLISWRPKLLDIFFLGFLAAPPISSMLNGLGPYDAASSFVNRFLEWGIAYWVGRSLFTDLESLRDICVGVVVSAVAYAPLCLYEIVMSPQLNRMIYGFRPSSWAMTKRFGGWRPTVFMQHGLALAAWIAAAALVAWILWRSKAIRNICGIPIFWIAITLAVLTIMLRSTGAALLLVGLIAVVEIIQATRVRPLLLVLILAPMVYIGLRTTGWEGQQLVHMAEMIDQERADSLSIRLENDQLIVDKAMNNRPFFGWGGWGRWRVRDQWGNDITISDSWWGILVGTTGAFGLVCTYATFISPLFPLALHKTRRRIFEGASGAAWALGFGVLLFVLDTLANAMPNTSFMLMAATLVSVYPLVSPKAMNRMMSKQQSQTPPTAQDRQNPLPHDANNARSAYRTTSADRI
ncbi:MAG: hypothetical protein ACF8K1_11790 [Phycisphaerales bacterium JB047]